MAFSLYGIPTNHDFHMNGKYPYRDVPYTS